MLYAGTDIPLPEMALDQSSTSLRVRTLKPSEEGIRAHFTKNRVQYIGSTEGCGCSFPNAVLGEGGWFPEEDTDPECESKVKFNREKLFALLESSGESVVELYGVWAGDYDKAPQVTESIALKTILDADFFFKEQGFYRVACRVAS
jgi:hypothetical protein